MSSSVRVESRGPADVEASPEAAESAADLQRGGGGSIDPPRGDCCGMPPMIPGTLAPWGPPTTGEERGSVLGRAKAPSQPGAKPGPIHAGEERGSVLGRSDSQGERRAPSRLAVRVMGTPPGRPGGGGISWLEDSCWLEELPAPPPPLLLLPAPEELLLLPIMLLPAVAPAALLHAPLQQLAPRLAVHIDIAPIPPRKPAQLCAGDCWWAGDAQ
mmetsp:Transcript_56771/g.112743  ORF Transcript_56771/g.112743 Transcript_56771/m.112743 type:complete len:214 (-) Transcript_56771:885-1526(-)